MNLRDLLLQMAGEEELKLQKEEQDLDKREVIAPGFHVVKWLDEELDDTDEETE